MPPASPNPRAPEPANPRQSTIAGMLSHGKRWKYAFRAFFSLIFQGYIADDILAEFAAPAAAPPVQVAPAPPVKVEAPVETNARAVQILAILQRDGRLVDFLM